MRKHKSQPQPNTEREQPHDSDRDERQPYAKELDDYAHGVANPPEQQNVGRRPGPPVGKGSGKGGAQPPMTKTGVRKTHIVHGRSAIR
jgi:hypothetical protein